MSPNVRVKDCNENNDIWWNSINLDMTWSTKYQVIYVANIKWTLIFQLLVKVWKSNHVSLNPWNAALEVSDLNEKLQSGLFGGGGQNSLSQLWTNTSLSPNLVIHSPPPSDSLSQKFCWTVVCSFNVLENELNITSSESKTAQIFGEKGCNLIRTESLLKVRCCSEGTRNF